MNSVSFAASLRKETNSGASFGSARNMSKGKSASVDGRGGAAIALEMNGVLLLLLLLLISTAVF